MGSEWIDDCIPTTAEGTFHPRRATIHASRVRHGRYTRLTVRFRAGSKMWDKGSILYVDHYRLKHYSGKYFIWLRTSSSRSARLVPQSS